MVQAAAEALATYAPINDNPNHPLLPNIEGARDIAPKIAIAVAKQAILDGVATTIDDQSDLEALVNEKMWQPQYVPYEYVKK